MKWSFASAGLIIFGLFGIIIIILFHEITVSNEQDYFTLKEATEASMIEAVDTTYYRLSGKIKINEEKFVEDFIKRFVKSATFGQGNYYIDFYQISEYPAIVNLRIVDATNSYNIYTSIDESVGSTQTNIVNELSAILDGYEPIEEKKGGIVSSDYWNTPGPIGAEKPTIDCSDGVKYYDLTNELCIYNNGNVTTATIECPRNKPYLVEGWCVKN